MSTQHETMPAETEVQVKQPRGCVFYGCLTAVLLSIGAILCCGIGPWWFISSQVQKYTAEAPVELPSVEYSEEELAALETRLSTFSETLEEGDTPQDLVLTAEEINALIGKQKEMRGKVFVKIEDGEISGDVSIPADAVWGGDGRFFNASASFNVSMEEGVLIVTLAGAEVNGERIPDEYMQAIGKENLAKDVYKDPKNAKVLRRFESIQVVEDKIVIKLRPDAGDDDQDEPGVIKTNQTESQADTESEGDDDVKEGDDVEADSEKEAATAGEPSAT